MTIATIRAQIKTTLDTVSNVGQTHNYQRWAVTRDQFLALYKATIGSVDQIRGWDITYRGFTAIEPSIGRDAAQIRTHTFAINGWLGLDDSASTETTFTTLAEAICNALENDTTLNAAAMSIFRNPVSLTVDHRLLNGVLCHHAEITLQVVEGA